MVKSTQTFRRQKPENCLSVFEHFVGLARKGLKICDITADWKIKVFLSKNEFWISNSLMLFVKHKAFT